MNKQKGMTLIGMLMTMAVVVISGIVVMRVVPVYIQYYAIVQSIKSLDETPSTLLSGDSAADVMVLKDSLNKRLDMNGVDDLKPNELSIASETPNVYVVKLNYKVIKPLICNVSLLFDFQRTDKVKISGEN